MKGTDCTPEQIANASDFMARIGKWPASRPVGQIDREDVAVLLAWYGALRYQAGRDGTGGTFEHPGPFDKVSKPEPAMRARGQR